MEEISFHDLFSDLPGTHKKNVPKGSVLFRQGDEADLVYYVVTGELKLMRYTTDGHTVCLHTAYDGESFAEAALFTDIYHCNGEVVKDSVIWCYPRLEVLKKISEDTECTQRFYSILAAQVRHLRFLTELRSIQSAQERVMQFLRMRADNNGRVILRDTLYDTAKELGLAHETFYRTLRNLEKDGLITRKGKRDFMI